jgi:hypothetical protein
VTIGRSHKHITCPSTGCQKKFTTLDGAAEHAEAVHGMQRNQAVRPTAEWQPKKTGRDKIVPVSPVCSDCGKMGRLVGGAEVYPHRPDLFHKSFYKCVCGAYCGCHPGTIVSLGKPAGEDTRRARLRAHSSFDRMWRHGTFTRTEAYNWLAKAMGMEPGECHIGWMNEEQANRVTQLVRDIAVAVPIGVRNANFTVSGMAENGTVVSEDQPEQM